MEHVRNLLTFRKKVDTSEQSGAPVPTTPKPKVCPICKGAGYARANVQPGHPAFGKAIMCKCKADQVKAQQAQELAEVSGILTLKRFQSASFSTFCADMPGVRVASQAARMFADAPLGWLVLTGPYGCGKTHLAVAIAKYRLGQGDTVLVQTVPDLLDHLRSAFDPRAEQSFDATFQQMRDVDLLVLDDYGAEQTTAWAGEKLFQIFNHRYNKSLPTVVTSNNIHLQGIDPRVYSRLHDRELSTIVVMESARDYRMFGNQVEGEEE